MSECLHGGRVRQIREDAESQRGMGVLSINFDNQSIHFGSDSISLQIQYWTGVFTILTLNYHLCNNQMLLITNVCPGPLAHVTYS